MTDLVPTRLVPRRDVHFVRHIEVMGTVVTIDLYGASPMSSADISPLLDAACASLQQADDVFSTWKKDSPMSRLRRGEISVEAAPPRSPRCSDSALRPVTSAEDGSTRGSFPAAWIRPAT